MASHPNDLNDFVGLWGVFPHLLIDIDANVHHDDVDRARGNLSAFCVYHVDGVEGEYFCLRYRGGIYRMNPSGFILISTPSHDFDDRIFIQRSKGPLNKATIVGIFWHFGRNTHYYRVTVDGKMVSRWIFEEDILEKILWLE